MSDTDSRVRALLARRQEFLQVAVLAAVLATGVNLITDYVLSFRDLNPWSGAIGAALIAIALIWLMLFMFRQRTASFQFEASVLYDEDSKRLVSIDEYAFAHDVAAAVRAVLSENAALRQAWEREPLVGKSVSREHDGDFGSQHAERMSRKSVALLREALEYVLLETLSLHLSEHFDEASDAEYVRTYGRNDIPELLLQNRVLSLLSAPYEDRAPFTSPSGNPRHPQGEVVMIMGPNGAMYSRFQLVLPRGTRVRRTSDGLVFDSPRLSLTLGATYDGFSTNDPPRDFIRLYLKGDPDTVHQQLVRVSVSYKIKPLALLLRRGWEYYGWVDSFIGYLRERVDVTTYLERIQWPTIQAMFRIGELRKQQEESERGDDAPN